MNHLRFFRIRKHPFHVFFLFCIAAIQITGLLGIGLQSGLLSSARAASFTIDSSSGTATVGESFSGYNITSSNPSGAFPAPPTVYAISPPSTFAGTGLTFDPISGLISGIPTSTLTATLFTIAEASEGGGGIQTQLYTLTVLPAPPPPAAPDPVQLDSISGISPASGPIAGGTSVTVTGSFPSAISGVQINGAAIPQGSWTQTSSGVTFTTSSHAAGVVAIQFYDGQAPLLASKTFTYTEILTPSPSAAPSPTPSPSATPTPSPSVVPSPTPSATPTPSPSAAPSPTPSATPTPSPSATPTPSPSPSVVPSPTPSATPTPSPSVAPSPTPSATPSVTPTPTPTRILSFSLSKTGLQLISGNLLSDDPIIGPLMTLTTAIVVGDIAAGKSTYVIANGLLPGTTVYLYIFSSPQLIGSAVADSSGTASISAVIPSGLPPGDHKIIASGTGINSQPLQAISAFRLNANDTVLAYSPPAQVSGSLTSLQSRIEGALNAGKPLYDIKLHPGAIGSIALATGSFLGVAGAGGLTRIPHQVQAKLASIVTKKLKVVKKEEAGRGDLSSTWKLPGTSKTDHWIKELTVKSGLFSAVLPRVLVDGAWARAIFGAAGFSLWGFGIVIGVLSSIQVKYQALPPKLIFVLIIIALGILDSAAGALAWVAISLLTLVTGHLTNWSELRTLLGMFVLFSSIPLLAHAIRPLRRDQEGSLLQKFDRLADYAMPPIFLAFAASSMFKALNGLSGFELVNKSEFGKLRAIVIIFFFVRLLLEDVALHWYPRRSLECQPGKLSSQSQFATWLTIFGKVSVFILIATPFFGLGIYTFLAAGLTASMLILKVFEEKLPNSPQVNKWFPRGVANFLFMMVIGIYVSALILGSHPSDQKIKSTYALIMVPGIIAGLITTYGREGGNWPENWHKRLLGALVWFTALGLVMGFITL